MDSSAPTAIVTSSEQALNAEPPEISVVMPCLNEAAGVGVCVTKALQAIKEMGTTGEVIIVDNGSTDDSAAVAAAAGARVVHERRRGYGSAYLRGFAEARGRYIVMGDADDTYDFLDIPRFIAPLRAGKEMVIGNRFSGRMDAGAMPWSHRYIGNPVLSGTLRLLFSTRVRDSHCGMRAFTREAYDRLQLKTTGMEFASELVVASLREGLSLEEIGIAYRVRIGESKLNSIEDAWRHVRFLLMYSPGYIFRLPGSLLTVVGAVLLAALSGGPIFMFGRLWQYHVLLFGVLSLILGINLLLFDLFAKAYAMGAGLVPRDKETDWLLRVFSLERGLGLGIALFLGGFAIEAEIVYGWIRSGYGQLDAIRPFVIGMTGMVVGAQVALGSFLTGLLLVKHR